jgi:hypothetical protein
MIIFIFGRCFYFEGPIAAAAATVYDFNTLIKPWKKDLVIQMQDSDITIKQLPNISLLLVRSIETMISFRRFF